MDSRINDDVGETGGSQSIFKAYGAHRAIESGVLLHWTRTCPFGNLVYSMDVDVRHITKITEKISRKSFENHGENLLSRHAKRDCVTSQNDACTGGQVTSCFFTLNILSARSFGNILE